MSVTVDANILLYASDTTSPRHERALNLVQELAAGPALLYVFWPVLMSYLHISTHPAIHDKPLPIAKALSNLDDLIRRPHVKTPGEDDGFWAVYRRVEAAMPVRGNLVPDAHIVALMHQYGVHTILTHDRGFRRFEGIQPSDPF